MGFLCQQTILIDNVYLIIENIIIGQELKIQKNV